MVVEPVAVPKGWIATVHGLSLREEAEVLPGGEIAIGARHLKGFIMDRVKKGVLASA